MKYVNVPEKREDVFIDGNLSLTKSVIENWTGKSADVIVKDLIAGKIKGLSLSFDGMYDQLLVAEAILEPLKRNPPISNNYEEVLKRVVTQVDSKEIKTINEAIDDAMAGFFVIFFEGQNTALSFSVQGFSQRSVEEPESETQERGSKEGFTENFKVNMTLIRRRLRSPDLRFEILTTGVTGNNRVCICSLNERVDPSILEEVKNRIENAEFDTVLSTGYLQPFLDTKYPSFFSGVGLTERPDTLVAKLCEGKVGIILDGTPYVIYVPHTFAENLHSFDDYAERPFFAAFIRLLKLTSFLISILLPGMYVALAIFHQELFPGDILFSILSQELKTPFPVMIEALIIHVIFEVMREAGLRMPKAVGHAVSIVGALVIGEAAVTAGLIAAPMLIVVALTAISSFVIPQIYGPIAVLRLAFIIIGGTLGFYGIILGLIALVINMTAISPYGVPYTEPVAPLRLEAFRDFIWRQGWEKMSKKIEVDKMRR